MSVGGYSVFTRRNVFIVSTRGDRIAPGQLTVSGDARRYALQEDMIPV